MISNIKGPCVGCEKREMKCHSYCEEYKKYKEQLEEIKVKQEKERLLKDAEYEGIHRRGHFYLHPRRTEKIK